MFLSPKLLVNFKNLCRKGQTVKAGDTLAMLDVQVSAKIAQTKVLLLLQLLRGSNGKNGATADQLLSVESQTKGLAQNNLNLLKIL